MTSQAQALDPLLGVGGLAFLGFPLHPAGKPGTDRADHLRKIAVPLLFVSGDRDALAEMPLLEPVVVELGEQATLKTLSIGKELDDLIDLVGMNNYQSALTRDRQGYRDSLDVLEKILDTPNLGRRQPGRALQARASVRSALDDGGALVDYDEAVRLLPEDPFVYDDRAAYHERTGRDDLAARDRRKARDLRSALPSGPPR